MNQVHDRPMWPPAAEIQAQAYDAFEAWRQEHDPDGELDLFEAIDRYAQATTAV